MDLRRLEVFVKLMETKSFSQTGIDLNLTQPTVSGHIKTLEQQLGVRLFDRHRRLVKPTSSAIVLYDYALKILELRDEAGFALERHRGRISGSLVLGGSTIPGTYILPPVIGRFHQIYPETRLKLRLSGTMKIVEAVYQGDLEMGMAGAVVARDELAFEPLVQDRLVLVMPRGKPYDELAGKPLRTRDILRLPFIIREDGSGTRAVTLKAFQEKGVDFSGLKIVAEMGSNEAVQQAVMAGLGVSILSILGLKAILPSGLLQLGDVQDLTLKRQFYVVTHRDRTRSPVCSAFLEFLRTENFPTPEMD